MSASGNNDENPTRKGKGRQKVNMVKMENESNLQVTFSKRCNGMFKKVSELNTRCGAESALVVFSPGGKPYSFGHLNVEAVVTRFLGENDHNPPPRADQLLPLQQAERQMIVNATMELNQVENQLDIVKNHANELDQMTKQVDKTKQMGNFNYQLLDQMKEEVFDFKGKLQTDQAGKDQSSATPYFLGPNPNLGAAENFELIGPSASSFDPQFYYNLQGMPSHFSHFYRSEGINIFGNNVPLVSYINPPFVGTSTFQAPDYAPILNASSSFVIPYNPVATDPTATIPINPPEDESSVVTRKNAGEPRNDDE